MLLEVYGQLGGKVVIPLEDFRQTCPVIPSGTKTDVLNACISRCHFWQRFHIAQLITAIRNAEDPALASFVDEIRDGAGPQVVTSLSSSVRPTSST